MVQKLIINGSTEAAQHLRAADNKTDLNAAAAGSGATAASPSASTKTVRLLAIDISSSAAASLRFHTASGTCYRTPKLAADTPFTRILANGVGFPAEDAGDLTVTSSAAANITGTIEWIEE